MRASSVMPSLPSVTLTVAATHAYRLRRLPSYPSQVIAKDSAVETNSLDEVESIDHTDIYPS